MWSFPLNLNSETAKEIRIFPVSLGWSFYRARAYTVKLSGKIDGIHIQPIEVEPEEVQSAELLAFPAVAGDQEEGMKTSDLLAVAGFVFGLGGLVLGFIAFRKTR